MQMVATKAALQMGGLEAVMQVVASVTRMSAVVQGAATRVEAASRSKTLRCMVTGDSSSASGNATADGSLTTGSN